MDVHVRGRGREQAEPELRWFWTACGVFFGGLAIAGAIVNLAGLETLALLGVELYVVSLPATIFHAVLAGVAWTVRAARRPLRWHHNVAYGYSLGLLIASLIGLMALLATGVVEALVAAAIHLSLAGWGAYEGTVLDQRIGGEERATGRG